MSLLANHFRESLEAKMKPVEIKKEESRKPVQNKPNFIRSEQIMKDVFPIVESNEFYEINYIGTQGHGKTFSASEFATHAMNAGFLIIYGKAAEAMRNLDEWKEKVKQKIIESKKIKICFVVDDGSYASSALSPKKAAAWKNFVADIRHQFENILGNGIKPKVFIIFISHRYHAVPPIMRNAKTWIFGSMDSEDRQDAQKLIPRNKEELEQLDMIYKFIAAVSADGPRVKDIPLIYDDSSFNFRWGNKEDPGDGRLMMVYHKGRMDIFNPRRVENMIDLDDYRIEIVGDEISQPNEDLIQHKEFQGLPQNTVILKKDGWRSLVCQNCGNKQKTRRKEGELIQCAKCNKTIERKDVNKLLSSGLEAGPVQIEPELEERVLA